ncbi:DUF3592 domain-containing protein [Planomonospora venezuelensis]|uniref:DUF3592 domain-containing protein n=1 Tax=Planomonospora venezuelensis TaxID=1999 RepID=A0A841CW63_PLAVE|nr:DUF3592 domain-containing protein [Planomonospora venezuelensis]MBB5961600.1 hypothetical protein [Planomonospora venezuelensis]GIM98746.1 hypothetical protein Pve01_04050 [Planomonospora venezuelensis]
MRIYAPGMLDMEYSKTFRPFLFIPGAHIVWLPIGLFFVIGELTGNEIPMKSGSALTLGIIFCSFGVAAVVATVVFALCLRMRDRRRRALLEYGLRARAVVTEVSAMPSRINGRQLMKLHVSSPEVPGLAFRQVTFHPVPEGTDVTVAYDPEEPGRGVVADDLRALARAGARACDHRCGAAG